MPSGRCVFCRYDTDADGLVTSRLYLTDFGSKSVQPILCLERFRITVFATDPDWSVMVVAGFGRETDIIPRWLDMVVIGFESRTEALSVGIYGGRFTEQRPEVSIFYNTRAMIEPELSAVYDEDSGVFYVAYAVTNEVNYVAIKSNDEILSADAVYVPRSYVTLCAPLKGIAYTVGDVGEFIRLGWAPTIVGNVGFSFYDEEGKVLKGYGYFDPATEEFVYPVDVEYSDSGGGFGYLFPVGAPDEGCNIGGTYLKKNGERKDIYLSDKVIAGPIVSGKGEALVYIIRDRDTAQAKIKAKSIETGEEFILDLPYDPEPALTSRYRLLFVE